MTPPDASERLTRRILSGLGVRPVGHQDPNDADAAEIAAAPPADPDSWWDDLYPEQPEPHPERPPAPRLPPWWSKKPTDLTHKPDEEPIEDEPDPAPVETSTDPDPEPADTDPEPADDAGPPNRWTPQPDYWPRPHLPAALTHIPDQAAHAISPGTRRLLYNISAAGAGWALGLYQPFAHAIADCAATTSIGGGLTLGVGGTVLIAHVWDRRTRHWWPGIAWIARIPLATAILALALWAPAAA